MSCHREFLRGLESEGDDALPASSFHGVFACLQRARDGDSHAGWRCMPIGASAFDARFDRESFSIEAGGGLRSTLGREMGCGALVSVTAFPPPGSAPVIGLGLVIELAHACDAQVMSVLPGRLDGDLLRHAGRRAPIQTPDLRS